MKEYAPGVQSSELRLVAVPTTSRDAADAVTGAATSAGTEPARESTAPSADRFLAKATKEYAAGNVDLALWERAVTQAGGDEAQAKGIYLHSRATALRVAKRNEEAARRARVVEALSDGPGAGFSTAAPLAPTETTPQEPGGTRRGIARPTRGRVILVAGVLGCLVVVGGLIAALSGSGPDQQVDAAKPAPGLNVSGHSMPSGQATSVTPKTSEPAGPNAFGEDFVAKVRALEDAGNWNVVVLYAVEWARKHPESPEAWKELSRGYIKLRQYGEALDAATKAVQLAPEDFLQWQNLGQVNVALQRPVEALGAFHQAAALNQQDVVSLVQEGILNTQLGRLPDARNAFAKALAVSPDDEQALCGAAAVAQKEGRVKDADALTRQVTSLVDRCRDPSAGESVRVTTRVPAQKSSALKAK